MEKIKEITYENVHILTDLTVEYDNLEKKITDLWKFPNAQKVVTDQEYIVLKLFFKHTFLI